MLLPPAVAKARGDDTPSVDAAVAEPPFISTIFGRRCPYAGQMDQTLPGSHRGHHAAGPGVDSGPCRVPKRPQTRYGSEAVTGWRWPWAITTSEPASGGLPRRRTRRPSYDALGGNEVAG